MAVYSNYSFLINEYLPVTILSSVVSCKVQGCENNGNNDGSSVASELSPNSDNNGSHAITTPQLLSHQHQSPQPAVQTILGNHKPAQLYHGGRKLSTRNTQHTFLQQLSELKILCLNGRSILPKFDELVLMVQARQPVIVSVVESWLDWDVDNSEINISGYQIFRADRSHHGGEVLVYIKNHLTGHVIQNCYPDLELL